LIIRKAVIVAAGLSSRLYPLTETSPKPLLKIGDETLIGRSLRLLEQVGVETTAVVVGYKADLIKTALGAAAEYVTNPFYRHCNNMGSLWMAEAFVHGDPFLYLHGDLIYDEQILESFVAAAAQSAAIMDLLVDFGETDEEAMKVQLDESGRMIASSKLIPAEKAAGEWTGIAVIRDSVRVFDAIEKHLMTVGLTDYDTAAFTTLASDGNEIRCFPTEGRHWKEIDDLADLENARSRFAPNG
jgi:L-glutamine-phosphate cytidylyltransferase